MVTARASEEELGIEERRRDWSPLALQREETKKIAKIDEEDEVLVGDWILLLCFGKEIFLLTFGPSGLGPYRPTSRSWANEEFQAQTLLLMGYTYLGPGGLWGLL